MGTLFIFLIMSVLFIIAMFLIIITIFFIIRWILKKRKGKNPKKIFLIITIVFLIIGLITGAIPVGFVGFLRSANSTLSHDYDIVESGKLVYWGTDEYGAGTTSKFEMDGVNYVRIRGNGEFFNSYDTWKLKSPVVNIKYKSDDEAFNKFLHFVFSYPAYISTLYPIYNSKNFDLYTTGNNIYSPESQKNLIIDYYKNLSHYDTQNCTCTYMVNSNNKSGYKTISVDITLKEGIFEKIYKNKKELEVETLKIPDKYINLRKENKIGTPTSGFYEIDITVYSNDKVAHKFQPICLIDDHVYLLFTQSGNNITVYKVDPELNKYLKDTIFSGME